MKKKLFALLLTLALSALLLLPAFAAAVDTNGTQACNHQWVDAAAAPTIIGYEVYSSTHHKVKCQMPTICRLCATPGVREYTLLEEHHAPEGIGACGLCGYNMMR